MNRLIGFLAHYFTALIHTIKNLFLPKDARVYTGAIPED